MAQYRYAQNEQGQIIDVLSLSADRPEPLGLLPCVGCGEPLIAKIRGEKKEKHFAHKQRIVCSPETYLHKLAKTTFYDVYRECLGNGEPFYVERRHSRHCERFRDPLGHDCEAGTVTISHDLTKWFDEISMERREGTFM